jgi:hypothetical protein
MRHPLDGNAIAADAHYNQPEPIGYEHGETCNRVPDPDEDMPRGYKPKPCKGLMNLDERDGMICCDTCGEIGN